MQISDGFNSFWGSGARLQSGGRTATIVPVEHRASSEIPSRPETSPREIPSPTAALKFSQILTAPNQLTLVRLAFLPFIIIEMFEGRYGWALVLFVLAGISDGLDGLLARMLHQQTLLGQYLDPIADKMLLSTVFMVLSILGKIPWKYTVMVFSRDACIVLISALLYTIAGLRDFRPSIFGKANTFAQLTAVVFVMLFQVDHVKWVWVAEKTFLHATFAFTIVSALHYVYLVGLRLRSGGHQSA